MRKTMGSGFQFGPVITPSGVLFSLWAPDAARVSVLFDESEQPLSRDERGFFTGEAPGLGADALYSFRVDDKQVVPDPASRWQPRGVHGPSAVIDPARFSWSHATWRGRPWEEAVIYETHIGTATAAGTYAAFGDHLEALRDAGITAIELMPLSSCAGSRNWGYDGVLPYAPAPAYGTPDALKALIDRAHGLGLMMLLDVVYNHFGPSGNYLRSYARRFFTERHQTPWGASINWDDRDHDIVRSFFIQNALYWLEAFHFDGLRLDAVHAIRDDGETHFLAELAETVRGRLTSRPVHLILENEGNQSRWLERSREGKPQFYTAQWADDIHNAWHVLLTGETEGYYTDYADEPIAHLARALAEGFSYQGQPAGHIGGKPRGEPSGHLTPAAFVSFLQNHDQIGNRAEGERLSVLADPNRLALAEALLLLAPQIPLLFQGEDWLTRTPFLFFVDFNDEPALARAVREGRAREFARFQSFGGAVPDPNAIETFERSVLDWSEAARGVHAENRARFRALLDLRRVHIIPLLKTGYRKSSWRMPGDKTFDISWQFEAGTLRLVVNLGEGEFRLSETLRAPAIWSAPGVRRASDGLSLPSWSAEMLVTLAEP